MPRKASETQVPADDTAARALRIAQKALRRTTELEQVGNEALESLRHSKRARGGYGDDGAAGADFNSEGAAAEDDEVAPATERATHGGLAVEIEMEVAEAEPPAANTCACVRLGRRRSV